MIPLTNIKSALFNSRFENIVLKNVNIVLSFFQLAQLYPTNIGSLFFFHLFFVISFFFFWNRANKQSVYS